MIKDSNTKKIISRFIKLNRKEKSVEELADLYRLLEKYTNKKSGLIDEVARRFQTALNVAKENQLTHVRLEFDKRLKHSLKEYIAGSSKQIKIQSTENHFEGMDKDTAESGLYGLVDMVDQEPDWSLGELNDVYGLITNMVLEAMKEEGLIWRKPWNKTTGYAEGQAHNYLTKTFYKGINYYLNWIPKIKHGYQSPYYFTQNQIEKLGGELKSSARKWPVVYFKILYLNIEKNKTITENEALSIIAKRKLKKLWEGVWGIGNKPMVKKFPALFYHTVYNFEDCTGLEVKAFIQPKKTEEEKIETAERIVDEMRTRPEIGHGGDRAFYNPGNDSIRMPHIKAFNKEQEYYCTLFHELIHSTGHKKRLHRDFSGEFGDKNYAFEELIAELGASYLCGESGILYFTLKNSAAYLQSWSNKLKEEMQNDPKFFLYAAAKAQKASDYILSRGEFEKKSSANAKEARKDRKPVASEKKNNRKSSKNEKLKRLKGKVQRSIKGLYGFTTADKAPEKPKDVFVYPGEIGKFLNEQQRYRSQIILEGDKHSSKSELAKQIADAGIDLGFKVALVDWEQGGLSSKDTYNAIVRNLKPENKSKLHISEDVPMTLEGLKTIADLFDMVIVDSGSKVKSLSNDWLDTLRIEHPKTIWVILMQRNGKGTTKGGASAGYNAPVVIFTHRPNKIDYTKNYATLEKNRGNRLDLVYLIHQRKVILESPSAKKITIKSK